MKTRIKKLHSTNMNRLLFAFSVVMMILTSGCSQSVVVTDFSKINGSFEIIKKGKPVDWYLWQANKANGSLKKEERDLDYIIGLDSTDSKDGKYSVRFDVKKCRGLRWPNCPAIFDEFDVNPGEKYEITFWVKNISSAYVADMTLVNVKGGGDPYKPQFVKSEETSQEWKKVTIIRDIAPNWHRIRFTFDLIKDGVLLLDDIRITRIK